MKTSLAVLAIALHAASVGATTEPGAVVAQARCSVPADEWNAMRGDLVSGAGCGDVVVSTDASDTRIYIGGLFRHVSLARIERRQPLSAPFELTMDWQWLTPGRWTLEIHGIGIVVLLGIDTIGFYVDDAQMMGNQFEYLPVPTTTGRQQISVRQTAREIVVSLDGRVVGRRALPIKHSSATLTVGIRGAPGERTKGAIRSLRVRSLTSP